MSLLFLGSTPLRVPARIGAFSTSLVMLAFLRPGRTGRHPALAILPLVLLSLATGLVMPGQSSPVAALAQVTLYVAVLAPLVWVSHRPLTYRDFRRVVLLLWAYNALSAAVGVLQVYSPGLFQAQLSSVITNAGDDFVGSLSIQLADGSRTLRPMGLTDMPGGAAGGGSFAILFGIGLLFVAAESLAAGTPAVVTPVGGLPEVVAPLSAGLVTEAATAGAERLGECLGGAVPTAAACAAYARVRFAWPAVARQVAAVYREAVAGRS